MVIFISPYVEIINITDNNAATTVSQDSTQYELASVIYYSFSYMHRNLLYGGDKVLIL
jgi:hypothetical protein